MPRDSRAQSQLDAPSTTAETAFPARSDPPPPSVPADARSAESLARRSFIVSGVSIRTFVPVKQIYTSKVRPATCNAAASRSPAPATAAPAPACVCVCVCV